MYGLAPERRRVTRPTPSGRHLPERTNSLGARTIGGRSSEYDFSSVERFCEPLLSIAANAPQPGDCKKSLLGKPAASVLTDKVPVDGFDLAAELRLRHLYEKIRIAEITIIFRNLILQY